MTAAERLTQLRTIEATTLCSSAEAALTALIEIMNRETTLLRAGDYRSASELSAEKARIAQDYVGFARAVQDQANRIKAEAPAALAQLQSNHERLATQMAENMRVLATARNVTRDLLNDVATAVGAQKQVQGYGANGQMAAQRPGNSQGFALNRAL